MVSPHNLNTDNNYLNSKNLTKRESEILEYIGSGYTAKKMAQILRISSRTVEKHMENLKYKLKCNTKLELAVIYKKLTS